MKLAELAPKLYRNAEPPGEGPATFATAALLEFDCPNGCAGHKVHVRLKPCDPSGWDVTGDSFENVTLRPSVLLRFACGWHGFVTNGEVETC